MTDQIIVTKKDNQVTIIEKNNTATVSVPGMQGPRGSSILNGHGLPSSSIGEISDYYLDADTDILYGPKTSSGWPSSAPGGSTPAGYDQPRTAPATGSSTRVRGPRAP